MGAARAGKRARLSAPRVADADAFVHVQDMPGRTRLISDAFAEHEGGFAAAAALLSGAAELYHADTTQPHKSLVRPLAEEIARVLRGRAINPRWIAGQMRHGTARGGDRRDAGQSLRLCRVDRRRAKRAFRPALRCDLRR